VPESLHVKVVLRATEIKGGAVPLAQALGISPSAVQAWMHSAGPVPERYFMQLLDLIAEETLRELTERSRTVDGSRKAGRR
jgi:hypothetical protein